MVWYRKYPYVEVGETWKGWSMECLNLSRAGIMFKMGLPMAGLEILNDWIMQVIVLIAGTFGTEQVAAVGILMTFLTIIMPFLHGTSYATQIRVQDRCRTDYTVDPPRNASWQRAQRSYMVGFGLVMSVAFVIFVLMEATQLWIGDIFSDEQSVVNIVADMAPIAAVYFFVLAVGFVHSCVLEALGQSCVSHVATVVCNW